MKKNEIIGIIGAMDEEVSRMKECLENVTIQNIASMDFYEGQLFGVDVVVVRSGIGKVNAAICTQILVDVYKVTAIINTGVAGSLNSDINIGDIVLSEDTLQHDVDATAFGYERSVVPRMESSVFKADEELIKIAREACTEELKDIQVFVGRILSGDQFISGKEKKEWLVRNFSGYCTEMEGAAIAHAAYLNRIPFLVIRAISDKADDSADMDYSEFETMAIQNSVRLLQSMLKKLSY